jgi:hypothetical protein
MQRQSAEANLISLLPAQRNAIDTLRGLPDRRLGKLGEGKGDLQSDSGEL